MRRRRGREGEGGNREVSPLVFSGTHGFPHASEPQVREVVYMVVAGQKAA